MQFGPIIHEQVTANQVVLNSFDPFAIQGGYIWLLV